MVYSRSHFLGLMITANETQQLSAWNLPNLHQKALLQLEQNYVLPYSTPSMHTANLASPGHTNSDLRGLNAGQPKAVLGLFKLLPPYQNISCPNGNLGNSDVPIDCASRKRFLIFDHSENQTKLFVSPSLCPPNHITAAKIPASTNDSYKEVASHVDHYQPFVEEKWDENNLNDGEMLEDSEEINALLYSSSDDEYDDDNDGENDEVTSTRHTLIGIEEGYNNDKQVLEEVASCDGSPKRQKLLDGTYKKSSLVNVESSVKRATQRSYEDDVESCYGESRTFYDGLDSSKIGKKVKIHEALKILGNIIPGLKSKDPLSIIEKSILYFETMKVEAEALGLSESAAFR